MVNDGSSYFVSRMNSDVSLKNSGEICDLLSEKSWLSIRACLRGKEPPPKKKN